MTASAIHRLLVAIGCSDPKVLLLTTRLLEDVLSYLSIELIDTVLAPGYNRRGEVKNNADLLKKAYEAGLKAVKNIK